MQYYDTGWIGILIVLMFVGFVLYNVWKARNKGDKVYVRRIAGLNAIDEAIGRATEMGRPVLMVPGLGGLDAIAVQAINIFGHVSATAARFATPIRLCCGDAAVYTVAQEVISEVYQREGLSDRYDQDSVRFISDRQFAFATGVSGLIHREKVAAAFLLGTFYAEALIFAETANSIGAIQVAGSTSNTQTPFFIAACDYVLIGDEFYAASAYLSREPVLTGALVGQDWIKMTMMSMVLFGALANTFELTTQKQKSEEVEVVTPTPERAGFAPGTTIKYEYKDLPEERTKRNSELWSSRLFNEKTAPTPERELAEPAATGGGN